MAQSEMILFTKDKMSEILDSLSIEVEEKENETVILDAETNQPAVCEACETRINTDTLGHIAHGSKKFYCKNPACFAHFVAKKRLWR